MTQVDIIVKMKDLMTKFQALRKRNANIEALALIGVTTMPAIVIAIVDIMMVDFCVELRLSPLSQDLF